MKEAVGGAPDRRAFLGGMSLGTVAAMAFTSPSSAAADRQKDGPLMQPSERLPHRVLTPAAGFQLVARGDPKPHTLTDEALIAARMTPESWRLEITADPYIDPPLITLPASIERSFRLSEGTAIDYEMLLELGKKHSVKFIKAMQCLNLATPLGQGLWEGVPLREVLKLCGKMQNVRRIYFWGYHNHDPKQISKASVTYTQAMETPPGEYPVILAYRLNGEPIPPVRGGPVRMVIPWSYGFKNTKWLNHLFITNDPRIPETYFEGNQNNDPDGQMKTAAYVDRAGPERYEKGAAITLTGHVVAGPSGVERVEYWLRRVEGDTIPLADDDPELLRGPWQPCSIVRPATWNEVMPEGVDPRELIGFDSKTGEPTTWPLKYGFASWQARLTDLGVGAYEFRARTVDLNGYAQPEPRPYRKNGNNAIQMRRFEVV